MEWLLTPIRPEDVHVVTGAAAWHGRLMVLGLGIFMPLGVMVARFFKLLPNQNYPEELRSLFWWRGHLGLQWCGAVLGLAGTGLILISTLPFDQSGLHQLLGWVALSAVGFQIGSGLLKGSKGGPLFPNPDGSLQGDHFSMTRRRVVFEICHKSIGYLALLLILAAVLTGLWVANAPVWMWMMIGMWWLGWIVAFVTLQITGFAFDTYRAIWGPDPGLPGNRRAPIGLGIRTENPYDAARQSPVTRLLQKIHPGGQK